MPAPAFSLAALLVLAFAPAPADDAAKLDPVKLLGTWEYVSGVREGEKVPDDRLAGVAVFTKETITLKTGEDATFVIPYKIDASKSPATVEMTIRESPFGADPEVTRGILKLEDDKLTFGYISHAAEFPKEFRSTAANGMHLFVLKKAAK